MAKGETNWEALYRSLALAMNATEEKLKEAEHKIALFHLERKQWEVEKISQNNIIITHLAKAKADQDVLVQDIQRLRAKLKELGCVDFD